MRLGNFIHKSVCKFASFFFFLFHLPYLLSFIFNSPFFLIHSFCIVLFQQDVYLFACNFQNNMLLTLFFLLLFFFSLFTTTAVYLRTYFEQLFLCILLLFFCSSFCLLIFLSYYEKSKFFSIVFDWYYKNFDNTT